MSFILVEGDGDGRRTTRKKGVTHNGVCLTSRWRDLGSKRQQRGISLRLCMVLLHLFSSSWVGPSFWVPGALMTRSQNSHGSPSSGGLIQGLFLFLFYLIWLSQRDVALMAAVGSMLQQLLIEAVMVP